MIKYTGTRRHSLLASSRASTELIYQTELMYKTGNIFIYTRNGCIIVISNVAKSVHCIEAATSVLKSGAFILQKYFSPLP